MSDTYLAVFVGSKTSAKMAAWNALSEAERKAKEKEGIAAWKAWVEKHQAALAAMMKYNTALKKAGVLITLDGLHPPSAGARVSFAGGKPVVTDGPFTESKEVLGGYWMIDVNSKEEAIAWARRCPASDTDIIEIRQVHEMSEFPADVQEAAAGFADLQAPKN